MGVSVGSGHPGPQRRSARRAASLAFSALHTEFLYLSPTAADSARPDSVQRSFVQSVVEFGAIWGFGVFLVEAISVWGFGTELNVQAAAWGFGLACLAQAWHLTSRRV